MNRMMSIVALLCVILPQISSAQERPTDPNYRGQGSWQQEHEDQWAIKRVGFTDDESSAWHKIKDDADDVIVAVIDTGLDWNHLDISWDNIWTNPGEIADNGIDDDGNGFIDDMIGWNFFANDNKPWDHDGHGTFVSGVIAGTWNNDAGIAGINPKAKIMVLKALNNFGHSRASFLAAAVMYATNNGAKIINMSVGGEGMTKILSEAIKYANSKGVVIIVAAGNMAVNVQDFGFAAMDEVVTVASTDLEDKRAVFSNWGAQLDIAAPGLDVLSLRARRTDFMEGIPGMTYEAGAAYVGNDNRYYRASGTSFSAPIVAGVASLVIANRPELSGEDVKRILLNSARDVDTPGIDQYTGYGLVDANAALAADKDFFIETSISGVEVQQTDGGAVVAIMGTTNADQFANASIQMGAGDDPANWKEISDEIVNSVINGQVGTIPAAEFAGSTVWVIRLITIHENGKTREARFRLDLG